MFQPNQSTAIPQEGRAKKLPVGTSDFGEIIHNDYNFVDKSLLIKEIIDANDKVMLFTRPRRWGKTLNLSMIQYFFAGSVYDSETKGLFDRLKNCQRR